MGGGGLGSVDAIENGLLLEGRPPSLGVTSWLPWRAEPSAVLKEEKQEKGDSATHERGQGEIEYYAPADPAVLVAPPVSTVGSVGNPGSLVSNILKSSAGNPGGGSAHLCDRCDGRHATCNCPHYSHDRPDHPDARFRPTKAQREDAAALVMLTGATVVPQPGDGNCLFHALSYGLADGSNAHALRQEVAAFLENNASTEISGTPLSEWVRWDTGTSISAYVRRIARGGIWGSGIELAAFALMRDVNVYVFEATREQGQFKCISFFPCINAEGARAVHVLYRGACHYDALSFGIMTSRSRGSNRALAESSDHAMDAG